MKKFIKILTSAFVATSALAAAVVTPIEITRNNNISNNQKTQSNINNKQIASQNTTNIDSILSKIPEIKVENIINNYFAINSSKNSAIFIENSISINKDKIIIQKAKKIINELYTKKLSYSTLIQKAKNKYNSLTLQQKEYIMNKIKEKQIKQSIHSNLKTSLFSYTTLVSTQTNTQEMTNSVINNSQNTLNQLNRLRAIAISMSVATAAQWIVAGVEASIWFIGWIEVGFTVAAAIADTAAMSMAWVTYNQAFNPIHNAVGELLTLTSIGFSLNDIWDSIKDLKKSFGNLGNNLSGLNDSMYAASAADNADLWADPANAEIEITIDTATTIIDCINLTLDTTMSILGCFDSNWKAAW